MLLNWSCNNAEGRMQLHPTILRAAVLAACSVAAQAAGSSISLAGTWRFRLDPQRTGAVQHWELQPIPGPDRIFLPGSTDEAGYGTKTSGPEKGWLSRPYIYEGPAWYETDVVIPETWSAKRITLFLERAHWGTEVWVDGKSFGSRDSLSVPHIYDLTAGLAPGKHRLTLCVDNSYLVDVGHNAHSVTEHTQTNWNGVVGRIELRATDQVWIDSVRLTQSGRALAVEATIGNATGRTVNGQLLSGSAIAPFTIVGREQKVQFRLPLAEARWDEFHPSLFDVDINLLAELMHDSWHTEYGAREIATRDRQFILNGRPIFLRGTVECNIFPLTGYPPTDVESWARIFRIARSYGLNHFRFHSNTPPEAAFIAADRAGFLLHVELPVWTRIRNDPKTMEFMRVEGLRILEAYGNHPSFTMLGLGNEFSDNMPFLDGLVADFKRADPRRLYTFSADSSGRGPGPTSDYYVGQRIGNESMRIHGTRFGDQPSSTDYDFSHVIEGAAVPVVAHELGQWVVFPDFSEISSYTGVLKPRNLEAFRAALSERGMIEQAADFQRASGAFAWLLYKEEIETALRTPHYGGVQLLQLEDFPGQGEALVGLVDSLWHSKGILTPEQFREFCAPTVPLLRFPKSTWTNDETFSAKAEVAHYGERDLPNATAAWSVRDDSGREIAAGRLAAADVKVGSVTTLGQIQVPLNAISRASHLRIALAIEGTEARNHWDFWVYPSRVDTGVPSDVLIAHAWDDSTRKALAAGRKVLLLWPPRQAGPGTLPTEFLPVFWSLSWFQQQPGTLGILCDPKHPAFAAFPTEEHSNHQWWDITQNSRAFILDGTASGFRPLIQVIDDYHRNHKLGAVFEARVGEGKLLACGFDLETALDRRLAARQLRASLLAYMRGRDFQPAASLDAAWLEKLFTLDRTPAH